MIGLPNTTIESSAVDPKDPSICRVTAVTTHPPAGDKVKIWIAIPTSNWNGRFVGIGGGGFSGGNARVQQQMGGPQKTSEFARLFMVPGVAHCAGGAGPAPYGQLDALVSWVEDGKAPATLPAARRDPTGTITRSRPLCQYPLVAKYKGTGSTDDAANFTCSAGF